MPTGFPDYYGGLTLPVTVVEGGTGKTTITANALLLGNGTGAMVETNVGTAGQVLQIPSGGGAPAFQSLAIDTSSISGILAIAHGGTGTATPALIAGAGISLAGSWPNVTITNSDDAYFAAGVLAIAHGGTGTATPGLVAGTGISITGSWPNNTITNSSAYATLADPLPVAHGGTGTVTPGLVAGSNISITGTWPNSTIALTSSPSVTGMNVSATVSESRILLHGNTVTPVAADVSFIDDTGGLVHGVLALEEGNFYWDASASVGDTLLQAYHGNLRIGTNGSAALTINTSQIVNFSHPLPITSGGTGAATLLAAGIPQIVAKVDLTGQTAAIGATTLITPAAAGMYRMTAEMRLIDTSGNPDPCSVTILFTQGGHAFSFLFLQLGGSGIGQYFTSATVAAYVDAGAAIQYSTGAALGGGDSYDIHIRLEAI